MAPTALGHVAELGLKKLEVASDYFANELVPVIAVEGEYTRETEEDVKERLEPAAHMMYTSTPKDHISAAVS